MIQFAFDRERVSGSYDLDRLASQLGVKWELVENSYEKSWTLYATRILDGLGQWCKDSGIKEFAVGHTQIAIQITFLSNKDAIYFKLRYYNA